MRKLLLSLGAATLLAACGSSASSSHSSSAGASPSSASSTSSMSSMSSGSGSASSAGASPAGKVVSGHATVMIANYAYHPATLTVAPGTKVTFTNHDQTAHTATDAANPGFDTGTVNPGKSVTVTLHKAGMYPYVCQFHAFMHGTIVVK